MTRVVDGPTEGEGLHLGVAVASWNRTLTDRLLEGALTRCEELSVSEVTVLRVPGALELPLAVLELAENGCDAVVAIGTVIKGATDHYDIVVRESSRGIADVSRAKRVPVANAILAVHDADQAVERSAPGPSNRGREAVDAAVQTATALRELRRE